MCTCWVDGLCALVGLMGYVHLLGCVVLAIIGQCVVCVCTYFLACLVVCVCMCVCVCVCVHVCV